MTRKLRIKLITIPWELDIATLSLPSLAAVTPEDKFEVAIIDLLRERLILEEPVDLVGITAATPRINAAYALADYYRNRGVITVLGGQHVTLLPHEGLAHANAVVVGEGEDAWMRICDQLLTDRRKIGGVYNGTPADLGRLPLPRVDLMKFERYNPYYYPVIASRGCPHSCSFCFTGEMTRGYRTYPIDHVIEQIKARPKRVKAIAFIDDNFAGNIDYTRELLRQLSKLSIKFGVQVRPDFVLNQDNVRLLKKAGCIGISTGFESIDQNVLSRANKSSNVSTYKDIITRVQSEGLMVSSNWMFGFDYDLPDIFDKTWEFLRDSNIYHSNFSSLIPFPGTAMYGNLLREGRILSTNYDDYVGKNIVVHKPLNMTKEQLERGIGKLALKFFSYAHQRRVFKGWPEKGMLFADLKLWQSYLCLKAINIHELFIWHCRTIPSLRWLYYKLLPYNKCRFVKDIFKKSDF